MEESKRPDIGRCEIRGEEAGTAPGVGGSRRGGNGGGNGAADALPGAGDASLGKPGSGDGRALDAEGPQSGAVRPSAADGARKPARVLPAPFAALACAQAISLFGNAILRFALPLYVLNLTGSSTAMGFVTACAWLPYIVLTPIGGVAADRVRKRRIMAALDAVMAVVCAGYLAFDGVVDIVGLSVVSLMVLYAVQSVYQPTVQSAVPALVGQGGIQRATAVISQISMLSSLVGPVLGGLVFGVFGIGPVVATAGVLFVGSIALLLAAVRIPFTPLPRTEGVVRTVVGDLREAFLFLREGRPVILRTILLATAFNLVMSAFIVIGAPVVITQTLGLSNQLMGFAEGAMALGGLAGGIAAGTLAGRLTTHRAPAVLAAGAAALLSVAVATAFPLGATASYALVVVGLFVTMGCCTVFSVQAVAFVQSETPGYLIGKVMAIVIGLSNCASPVGQLAYGWLLDALRGQIPAVVVCVVAVSLCLAAAVARTLRRGLEA